MEIRPPTNLPPSPAPTSGQDAFEEPENQAVVRTEIAISYLLRIGVLVSIALILVGTIVSFCHHPDYLRSQEALKHLTASDAQFPHTMGSAWAMVCQGRGQAMVVIGLLVLIATPVMRVAVSIFAFVYQRDRVYVWITSIVLALLLLSFFLGRAER